MRNKNWEQNYWQVKCFIVKNNSGLIWSTHKNLQTLKVRFFHHIKPNLKITLLERSFLLKAKPPPAHFKIQFLVENPLLTSCFSKVNSVQEPCAKCFEVHILKFEVLQITWIKWNKEHQTLSFQFFINELTTLMLFVLFFNVVCKISNYDIW